jgi:cellulose synthase/poly-beta-1,6-N-acetylglucosamine synthase-like glycosyltransferase
MVSVVIPAHNEERVLGRLLQALSVGPAQEPLEVLVVCNGCTDGTARLAASFPGVRVVQTPEPSKRKALRLADEHVTGFPRLYVDADVELGRQDVLDLALALGEGPALVVAPRRTVPRDRAGLAVRWYYDVWEELPNVRSGVFGRGVVALSEEGHRRIRQLPLLMSDDLAMSSAFTDAERRIVPEATVVVRPPRTWRALLRRRIRAATGTLQAYDGDNGLRTDSRTTKADLLRVVRRRPALALRMPFFLVTAVLASRGAARAHRRRDEDTWLRDDTSREG